MSKMYTLTLDEAQLNLLASSLAELPFKVSQPLIAELQRQVIAQNDAPPKADEG